MNARYFKTKTGNKLHKVIINEDCAASTWWSYNDNTCRWEGPIGYGYNPKADYSKYIEVTKYVESGLLDEYRYIL